MGSKRQGRPDHNVLLFSLPDTLAMKSILTEVCVHTEGRVLRQISHEVKASRLAKKTKAQKTAPL